EASGVAAPRELDAALADLEDLDFIRPAGFSPHPEYAFKHPLMADVAYRSQLGERRGALHAAVAAALEKLHGDRLGEYAAPIGHHWEASGPRVPGPPREGPAPRDPADTHNRPPPPPPPP